MKLRSMLGVAALLLTLAGVPWVLSHPQHAAWWLGGVGVVVGIGATASCRRLGRQLGEVTARLQQELAGRQRAELDSR